MLLLKKFLKKKKSLIFSDWNSFPRRIKKYINLGNKEISIIDVGANRGAFYKELTSVYKNSRVRALLIEPIPECINELIKHFSKNDNVKIVWAALSNIREIKDFFINRFDETSSLLRIKNNIKELEGVDTKQIRSIKITTDTLDHVVSENKFDIGTINLVKLDVQGFEDKVLQGAKDTLKRTEYIWIEVSFKPLYESTCLFNDVYSILNQSGFILMEICDGHRSLNNELLQANCLFKNSNLIWD